MNQAKIGSFLRQLRNERELTQALVAETFGVSNRTVSRWENGANLPDISVLLEIAEFYGVELIELLRGEREEAKMVQELKETVEEVNKYNKGQERSVMNFMHLIFIIAFVFDVIGMFLNHNNFFQSTILEFVSGVGRGMTFGIVIFGIILTSPYADSLRKKFT